DEFHGKTVRFGSQVTAGAAPGGSPPPGHKKAPRGGAFSGPGRKPSARDDVHPDVVSRALLAELDAAINLRVERVVAAEADVHARMEDRAALADEDVPRAHQFAAEALDAQALGLRVASVAGAARRLFMCHCPDSSADSVSLRLDAGDPELRVRLPVPLLLAVMLAAALLDDPDLRTPAVGLHGGLHRGTRHEGRADRDGLAFAH